MYVSFKWHGYRDNIPITGKVVISDHIELIE